MKITNKFGLPDAFVKAVSVERHNEVGTLSVTQSLKGLREIVLTERHWDEMTEDATERIWTTFGTAVHKIFELQDDGLRHEMPVKAKIGGVDFVGTVDSYDDKTGTVVDWKTASVWKVKMGDFADWVSQGTRYLAILRIMGLPHNGFRFVALLKDWSATEASRSKEYPQSPVFIMERTVGEADLDAEVAKMSEIGDNYHTAVEMFSDDDLPECTDEQRWASPAVFAVMKEGRKTAVRLFDKKADADALAASLGAKHSVVERPKQYRKCENYCPAKQWCRYAPKEADNADA